MNGKDIEDIYFKNSSAEILAALQKKQKIYVVSNCLELPGQLQVKIED
jgi:hypothetical protein